MNLISFVDELVKLGGVRVIVKRAADISSSEVPAGMMDPGQPPPSIRVAPDEAATRLLNTELPDAIQPGKLGPLASTINPIDRERFNHLYQEHR